MLLAVDPAVRLEVLTALDGRDTRLLPHLPYLLQDLWSLGADPEVVVQLLAGAADRWEGARALDLGCGKGAIAVALASRLGLEVDGIDAMPAFIDEARRHADRLAVGDRCHFVVGDLRLFLAGKRGFDVAIWGALGPLLGNLSATLEQLRPCVRPGGWLVLDDGYVDDATERVESYPTAAEVRSAFARTGWTLVSEQREDAETGQRNEWMTEQIRRRAQELESSFPHLATVFRDYVDNQERECDVLSRLVCATWLLRRER